MLFFWPDLAWCWQLHPKTPSSTRSGSSGWSPQPIHTKISCNVCKTRRFFRSTLDLLDQNLRQSGPRTVFLTSPHVIPVQTARDLCQSHPLWAKGSDFLINTHSALCWASSHTSLPFIMEFLCCSAHCSVAPPNRWGIQLNFGILSNWTHRYFHKGIFRLCIQPDSRLPSPGFHSCAVALRGTHFSFLFIALVHRIQWQEPQMSDWPGFESLPGRILVTNPHSLWTYSLIENRRNSWTQKVVRRTCGGEVKWNSEEKHSLWSSEAAGTNSTSASCQM